MADYKDIRHHPPLAPGGFYGGKWVIAMIPPPPTQKDLFDDDIQIIEIPRWQLSAKVAELFKNGWRTTQLKVLKNGNWEATIVRMD